MLRSHKWAAGNARVHAGARRPAQARAIAHGDVPRGVPVFICRHEAIVSGDIDHLWTLHELDEQVIAIDSELSKFPEQRRVLAKEVDDAKTRLEANATVSAD